MTMSTVWNMPALLFALLLIPGPTHVEAGNKFSQWAKKYFYGQDTDYKDQYEYLYGSQTQQDEYKQQQEYYEKQQTQAATEAAAETEAPTENITEYVEEYDPYSSTNVYEDDPGYSFFLEGTAGCGGSQYNLKVEDLVVNCGNGDYHGYDANYDYDSEEPEWGEFSYSQWQDQKDQQYHDSLYPKRHYCQFNELITVSGKCKLQWMQV